MELRAKIRHTSADEWREVRPTGIPDFLLLERPIGVVLKQESTAKEHHQAMYGGYRSVHIRSGMAGGSNNLFSSRSRDMVASRQGVFAMSKDQDRMVYRRPDGQWANERNDADRASSLHDTQKAAIDAAEQMLINQGGGELTVKGVDGKIRSKDTIHPGHDPRSVRDREH